MGKLKEQSRAQDIVA